MWRYRWSLAPLLQSRHLYHQQFQQLLQLPCSGLHSLKVGLDSSLSSSSTLTLLGNVGLG
jgi:hypothetical protein